MCTRVHDERSKGMDFLWSNGTLHPFYFGHIPPSNSSSFEFQTSPGRQQDCNATIVVEKIVSPARTLFFFLLLRILRPPKPNLRSQHFVDIAFFSSPAKGVGASNHCWCVNCPAQAHYSSIVGASTNVSLIWITSILLAFCCSSYGVCRSDSILIIPS